MRKIERIFVHCTASPQSWTVGDLTAEFKRKGWQNPGYHYVVTMDGVIHQMLPDEKISNGVKDYNSTSINVAYVGGINANGLAMDNRTPKQKVSMRKLLIILRHKYPQAHIMGHRDVWGKSPSKWHKMCPCFDAEEEYADICNLSEP